MTDWANALDRIADRVGRVAAWAALVMVVMTFLIVVLRYLFNIGSVAMQESILYLHASLFMLGAAYTLRVDGHVRVDIVYRKLSDRGRALVDLCGTALLLIPTCVFVVWISWPYVAESWAIYESSREAGGLPGVFLLKSLILVLPLLLLLQGLAIAVRAVVALRDSRHPTVMRPPHA